MSKNNKKLSTEEFIEKAKNVHGNKYDYSKVKYINNHTKICIICPEHGEFQQIPHAHLNGQGCPVCGGKIKLTTEQFIEKAKQVHDDRYDYSKVEYVNYKTKICIICPEHGEFWQTPINHLKGKGCPDCYGNRKLNLEKFIENARKIHGDKYSYSKSIYVNTDVPICIICPEHGEFWQTPYHHIKRKQGCPVCGGKIKLTTEQFIEKARKIHGDKYDYSKVEYANSKTKVCIICHEHGEFWQTSGKHLSGQGCPVCKESFFEKKTAFVLDNLSVKYIHPATCKNFQWLGSQHLDFYLPEYNLVIECQGEQHYKPVDFAGLGHDWANSNFERVIELDKIKSNKCKLNGLELYYIKYTVENIEKSILEILKKHKNE